MPAGLPAALTLLVPLLVALSAACSASAPVQGECQDNDHDGHGPGCAPGPDCDDDDPRQFEACVDGGLPGPDCELEPLGQGCPCVRGDRQPCFAAAATSSDVGPCRAGTQTCRDRVWSACEGAVLPAVEACNGVDDDCDGFTDEGVLSPCGGCDAACQGGVWGPPAQPFDAAEPLAVTASGELTLHWQPSSARTLWVPNTEAGTVSKLDAESAREVARYRTRGGYPIRVAVDHHGAAWVLDGTFGGTAYLSKLAAQPGDCRGRNGAEPHTSSGPDDVLALGADECVLLELPLMAADDARSLAIDGALAPDRSRAGNVWLGLAGAHALVELDGSSGRELARQSVPDFVPLASAFDPYGMLWSIDRAGVLLRFDPADPGGVARRTVPFACYALEALSIDSQGRLLMSGFGCESVFAYDPMRDQWRMLDVPALLSPRGILAQAELASWVVYESGQIARVSRDPLRVDAARTLATDLLTPFETVALSADSFGQLWAISAQGGPQGVGLATRFDPGSGAATAQVPLGVGPRGSGDFSGFASGGEFASAGSTAHVFRGCGRAARESDDPTGQAWTRWLRLHVAAVIGLGARVEIWLRHADREEALSAAEFQKLGELPPDNVVFPLSLADGGVLEVKLALSSPPAIGAPRVARVGIEWQCPGPE